MSIALSTSSVPVSTTVVGPPSAEAGRRALALVRASGRLTGAVSGCVERRVKVDGVAVAGVLEAGSTSSGPVVSLVRACERVVRVAGSLAGSDGAKRSCVEAALAGVDEATVHGFVDRVVNPAGGSAEESPVGQEVLACLER
jgi:hypothetical protein